MVLLITGLGPDLPGPRVREILGFADSGYEPCEPSADGDRTPPGRPGSDRSWTREADLPEPRDELRVASIGEKVYAGGGNGEAGSLDSFSVFSARSGSYRTLPDLPIGLDHPLIVAHQGDVYVLGGASDGTPQSRLFQYSPADGSWTEQASMRVARFAPTGAVIGARLYVAGGAVADREATYDSMEVYDFETGRWTDAPAMPTPRHHAAAAALDGFLYVAGGRGPGDFSLDAFERYDPRSRSWRRLPPVPEGVGGPASVTADGMVVVIGGGDDLEEDGIPPWVTAAVWGFDPATQSWRRLPDLEVARHGHAAAVAGGRMIVFGGAPCAGYGRTAAVESLPVGSATR